MSPRVRAATTAPGAWWVLGATVVAAVLWLQRLGANPLFVDEAASWSVAAQDSWSGWWHVLLHQEVAPPPFYLGLRAVVDTAGASGHVAMRLPVVVLTLPSVPLAAVLARRCGGGVPAVAGAAWLVALSPLMLMYAQQLRSYGPAASAVLLAVVLLVGASGGSGTTGLGDGTNQAEADQGGTTVAGGAWPRRPLILAGLAIGLAPWVHYVAWLPLVPVLAYAAWLAPWPARRTLAVTVLPLWIGAAVVAKVQYGHVGAGMDSVTDLGGDDLRRVLAGAWDGRFGGGTALLVLGTAGLLVAVAAIVAGRGWARVVAIAGVVGPLTIVVLSALGPDIVTTRYLVPCAPLLLVGVALLLGRLPRVAAVPIAVLLLAVGAGGIVRSLSPTTGDYPDFERIAGYTVPSLRPGSVIASESFFLGTWIPEYVAARAGVPGVDSAWGQGQLAPEVCARRRVLQLVEPPNLDTAKAFWSAAGYAATVAPTPTAAELLITATPRGPAPAACAALARTAGR